MQKVGAGPRRKSYAHIEPILPRKSLTRQSGTRTFYEELPNLSQELKSYRRRLVWSNMQMGQEGDGKGLPRIGDYVSQGSRKKESTLITAGSETQLKYDTVIFSKFPDKSSLTTLNPNPSTSRISHPSLTQPLSLQPSPSPQPQLQQQVPQQHIKLNIDDDNPNQDENQGYTMGNQVDPADEDLEDDRNKFQMKKKIYAVSHSLGKLKGSNGMIYQPGNQAELRMEQKYMLGKLQALKTRRQDTEFLTFLTHYLTHKKSLQKQTTTKIESTRTLANIKRASSLPKLPTHQPHSDQSNQSDKIQQIVIPSYEELINPDGNPEEYRRRLLVKRLENSVSFGRLVAGGGKGRGKGKDGVDYQGNLEEELGYLLETQRILRQKGIKIDSNTLKNSLLNLRQVPLTAQQQQKFPNATARLVSNPYEPKQQPKKKKKSKKA